ncbi:MAG: hypothetical protein M3680_25915 [Myxococcota bacterium]|nr:hypothetical protein [Myxococcota bacterium]
MRAVHGLLLVASLLAVSACADEPALSGTTQAVTTTNKIALNKIALNKIALNKIALNKIALNKIALNKIALNTIAAADLLDSAENREVLEYLISCAIPSGVTLEGTAADGVTYSFGGSLGLAPRWDTRRLTLGERRWVSACMLARVNNGGHSILISLRGPHNALTVTAAEANEYYLEEGSFYGDIFTPAGEDPVFLACRGSDLVAGELDSTFALRQCTQPTAEGSTTLCGMTYAGDCADHGSAWACTTATGSFYERCHATPSTTGTWDEGITNRYEEVITVFVKAGPVGIGGP